MSESHTRGRDDFLGHRQWNPPAPEAGVPAYQAYSQGWAEGKAIARKEQYGTDGREHVVAYPGGGFYHAWDRGLAEKVVADAGGGTFIETGRTVDDAIRQMKNDLDAIRRRVEGEG